MGEEIGMTDPHFTELDQYRDIESHNAFKELLEKGKNEEEALEILAAKSRDNGRTPMQWSADKHAGFTTGTPWLQVADNYNEINVEKELESGEIFPYYQKLIQLRKDHEIMRDGSYSSMFLDHEQVWAYRRELDGEEWITFVNFYETPVSIDISSEVEGENWNYLLGNYEEKEFSQTLELAPYEAVTFTNK